MNDCCKQTRECDPWCENHPDSGWNDYLIPTDAELDADLIAYETDTRIEALQTRIIIKPIRALPHTAIRAWVIGARNRRMARARKLEAIEQRMAGFLASPVGRPLNTETANPAMLAWINA